MLVHGLDGSHLNWIKKTSSLVLSRYRLITPTIRAFMPTANAGAMSCMVTRAKQLLPHLQVLVYPETGHASFFEQPERFNQDLERFVQAAAQENGVAGAGSR